MPTDYSPLLHWLSQNALPLLGIVTAVIAAYYAAKPVWEQHGKQKLLEQKFGSEFYHPDQIRNSTRYYVPPYCSSVDPSQEAELRQVLVPQEKLFDVVDRHLRTSDSNRHLLLLADSGMGKSSFVLNYYAHNQKQPRRKRHRLAVVPLGAPNANAYITKIADQAATIIFLDAYDEDLRATKDHRARLAELMRLCAGFKRILITCRTQFFPRDEEIPKDSGIVRVTPRGLGERATYEFWKLYLTPFSDELVDAYLHKRYGRLRWQKRQQAREIVAKIPLLSVRPMLLAYIPDVLDSGKEIKTASELYSLMLEKWYERESGWVNPDHLRTFSEQMAFDLYANAASRGSERVPGQELQPLAQKWQIALDDWQLRGRSLLNRDAEGNYKFAHRSIMEFLVVKRLLAEEHFSADLKLTDQMEAFLNEMVPDPLAMKPQLVFSVRILLEKASPAQRAQIGDKLAIGGDPRLEVSTVDQMQFCFVPAGPFWMGSPDSDKEADNDEKPLHRNEQFGYDYWVSRFPITVAQYQLFVTASGHKPADPDCLKDPANRPVRYVTCHEAVKFCKWLTANWHKEGRLPLNWCVRLPSEAEWEKAARGGLELPAEMKILPIAGIKFEESYSPALQPNPLPQRLYPWGNEAQTNLANYDETKIGITSAVGCFPAGRSPYGCEEMSGNVWEWCRTKWRENYKQPADDSLEGEEVRVLRGGAFHADQGSVRCAYRGRDSPDDRHYYLGFRVVVSPLL